jgi:hypothetical protein
VLTFQSLIRSDRLIHTGLYPKLQERGLKIGSSIRFDNRLALGEIILHLRPIAADETIKKSPAFLGKKTGDFY